MDPILISALAIFLLPLLSYVLLFFVGERLPGRGAWFAVAIMGVALVLALGIFARFWAVGDPTVAYDQSWNWFTIGKFRVDFGLLVDGMTSIMLVVVCLVSFLVHLFSTGYMQDDPRYARYFGFLGWFTFSMLGIVLSNTVFFLYVFWELVGVASYVLIGFFFQKPSAAHANKKAFIVNRVGDFGFFIGILMFFTAIGSFHYTDLFAGVQAGAISGTTLTWAGILLFMGCVGKSAQVPLHVWLPNAMEGPTPVSALIHAATMVAAGVYMTARLFPLFDPAALQFIAYTGAITAFLAATIAIVQTDIKRGLAYSTISQLGYMVTAVGVGSISAGMFHLTTHAFFKACLFLGSGAVIYAMHHEQDMRKMGGLRHKMPITFAAFLMSTIAISGVPPLSGFWSKDAILGSALAYGMTHPGHYLPFILTLSAAAITAFYMFRIVFLTFMGKPRDQHAYDHAREVDWRMATPLVVLGTLAVISGGLPGIGTGWFDRFVADPAEAHVVAVEHLEVAPAAYGEPNLAYDEDTRLPDEASHAGAESIEAHGSAHDLEHIEHLAHQRAMIASVLAAGLGILLSWLTYIRRVIRSEDFLEAMPGAHRVLWNKYYFDEVYNAVVVRGVLRLNATAATFDRVVVDGIVNGTGYLTRGAAWISGYTDRYVVDGMVNATAEIFRSLGAAMQSVQTGRVQNYFLGLVSGLVVLILVYRTMWMS
jgi:NADH-quinone oxidoreductase subunit L